jgi:aminomethyltransferase
LGKNIALAYVSRDFAALGSTLFVNVRGKVIEARVVSLPFYRRAV